MSASAPLSRSAVAAKTSARAIVNSASVNLSCMRRERSCAISDLAFFISTASNVESQLRKQLLLYAEMSKLDRHRFKIGKVGHLDHFGLAGTECLRWGLPLRADRPRCNWG